MSVVAHSTGKYRLIAELGQGGMADVYLAVSTGMAGSQKLMVVKLLRERMVQDEDYVEMFLDEGRLAMRLNHANVVQTFEVGVSGNRHFIVMEYLEGLSLNNILRAARRQGLSFGLGMHLRVLSDLLSGLDYAHNAQDFDGTPLGIVHRDITPHNTFVTYDGHVKVLDFGIAKAVRSTTTTTTGVIKGKISYMSPEQSRSEPVDRRADLFAVGIMLWEALTGERFWKDLADMTVLQRLMMNQTAPSPRVINPGLPDLAEAICAKALAPRPADRYATAADLQVDVEKLAAEMGYQGVTSREVGRRVSQFFAAGREKTRALIEAQMKQAPETQATLGEMQQSLPILHTTLTSSTGDNGPTPSGGGIAAPRFASRSPEAGGRRRPLVFAAILGVGVAASATATMAWRARRESGGRAVVASAATEPAESAAAAEAAPGQVSVRISATPPEAKLFLDDQPLAGNPYEGKLARDTGAHTLRAEAPGYQPKSRGVSLANDVVLDVELGRAPKAEARDERRGAVRGGRGGVKAPGAAASPSTAAAPTAAAPTAAAASESSAAISHGASIVLPKAPGFRPIVIDSTDPWKKEKEKEKAP